MPIGKVKKRKAAPKKKKTTTPAKKHVGDVLGLGRAKPPSKPLKSGGKSKRPKGIEITPRKRSRALPPARVRG